MTSALDAVRWLRSSIVKSDKSATAFEKRAFLRHFADISRPACQVRAQLRGVDVLPCTHEHCPWAFVQADWQISNELSSCLPKVVRVREALAADGWIINGQVLGDGIVLGLLNKKKIVNGRSPVPNYEPAECIKVPQPTWRAGDLV